MDKREMIQKLANKYNISYEDARYALENNNYDMLDAVLYLERTGKINNTGKREYKSTDDFSNYNHYDEGKRNKNNKSKGLSGLFELFCNMIDFTNTNSFNVVRYGKRIIRLPLTVIIIALIFASYVIFPLFFIGLFFNCYYYIDGRDKFETSNKILNGIAVAVEKIKDLFK